MNYEGTFAFRTDRGRIRVANEDQARVAVNANRDVLLVICDGMGGQNKGDYASKYACDALVEAFLNRRHSPRFTKWWIARTVKRINREIFSDAERAPLYKGMGTTLVAIVIEGSQMTIANIGDSRAYMYSSGKLERLTEDQTYVDFLYRTGKISESETKTRPDRHVLMNALGIFPSCSVDVSTKPYAGQSIICCSDGLYNNVSETEIRAVLNGDERADIKVNALIAEANSNGGSDNIAIALWEAKR